MKILGICGSPRKGKTTSYTLTTCLSAVREAYPEMDTELIELADMKIGGCYLRVVTA